MKTIVSLAFFLCVSFGALADGYKFETVPNDPLKARIYTLKNGLKVYMTVYKNEPRIQTYIVVRAGSKHDPADATGLAHYLEHMLFKGTDRFGTTDAAQEKLYLDQVIRLYDVYKRAVEPDKRAELYRQIDSLSFLASKFAIANEYDKMLAAMGAKGTNAFTSFEQTVYVNDIPSNQLEKWLEVEAERFRNPVMRLFHTELEVVYEEKNRTLDSDARKVFYELYANLFKKHQYGTQTTIGTIEHLKNPSISAVIDYYNAYYVPNNMAICLSGDFDPDEAIKLIDAKFGGFQPKPVPKFNPPKEDDIKAPIVKNVHGPDAESVTIGFRFGGVGTRDADMLTMCDMLLSNGTAGLIDLNLNQSQKVLNAGSSPMILTDYSVHQFSGQPRQGQSLEEVRDLILGEIENLKQGNFPDWLLQAVVTDLKLQRAKQYESNAARAMAFVTAFASFQEWRDYVAQIDRLSKITKKDVMDFAKKRYKNNYVVIFKRVGTDTTVQKVTKPPITPVQVNREAMSPFVKAILEKPAPPIEPVFVDFKRDIAELSTRNGVPIFFKRNEENELFEMSFVWDMGTAAERKLAVALPYLEYLGTSQFSPNQIKEEFYKLGCSFSVSASEDEIYVRLSGLQENFAKALELLESLLADAQPNPTALANLVEDVLKSRANQKLNKNVILNRAMASYAKYGKTSPFTYVLSESELRALSPDEMVALLRSLPSYEHRVLFYGPMTKEKLVETLSRLHRAPDARRPVLPNREFPELPIDENQVYFVNYDMKQAEILFLAKDEKYNPELAVMARFFNEYYGSGMSSVVFQELRESRALAYSTFAFFQSPLRKDRSHYVVCYIGAQADKLKEAIEGMMELNAKMPEAEPLFNSARAAVVSQLQTERIVKADVLYEFEEAKKLGLDYDLRRDVYEKSKTIALSDLKAFHAKHFQNRKYAFLVIGDESALDMKTLEKLGKLKKLTLSELFGEEQKTAN
ncbi:MAG: insulinase family protein [Chloroherpetonaceae bacterium]|nr:insulinase family protein [Chloroherpetonaceae bacterium]MDW8437720.1 insulinase family protein [Chloroherpetonaceae bacterium]